MPNTSGRARARVLYTGGNDARIQFACGMCAWPIVVCICERLWHLLIVIWIINQSPNARGRKYRRVDDEKQKKQNNKLTPLDIRTYATYQCSSLTNIFRGLRSAVRCRQLSVPYSNPPPPTLETQSYWWFFSTFDFSIWRVNVKNICRHFSVGAEVVLLNWSQHALKDGARSSAAVTTYVTNDENFFEIP